MKTGAQLYTIRSYTQNAADFACSMKKNCRNGLQDRPDFRSWKRTETETD